MIAGRMTQPAHRILPQPRSVAPHDDIVVLHGAGWADFQRMLEIRGDRSAPRFAYLRGSLEIMRPSQPHEWIKSATGCLIEAWCTVRGIEFSPIGSWLLEHKEAERGVEPDECYLFGVETDRPRPDLAIEVVWTSGGIDKLQIYRKLGVREVWYWEHGSFRAFALRDEQYVGIEHSEVLPGIDLVQIAEYVQLRPTSRAVREYRAALGSE